MSDTCSIDAKPTDQSKSQAFEPGPGKHVLYFGDPMCSWCWGFAPELSAINDTLQGRAQLHLVMGGLRPGTAQPWDVELRDYVRHHWQDVEAKTGQPFDYARFDDPTFVYDTEPGCRALVCARTLDPTAALGMFEALQRGFYAEGLNLSDGDVVADLAAAQGLDRSAFAALLASEDARKAVAYDFQRSQAFGVTGFPSVVCAEDGQYAILTQGYRPFAAIAPLLEEWLNA